MTRPIPLPRRLPLLLSLLAIGCGPIVQVGGNAPRPDALYTLTAASPAAVPGGQAPIDMTRAVTVDTPSVPGALQTIRIPVTVSDTAIQYVRGAQWAEQPNRLFQRLLADTLVHSGIAVVDQRSSGQTGGRRLTGQLLAFGLDVRDRSEVRVRFDATLAGPDGVRQRRFEREAAVSSQDGESVALALNGAANRVAADVASWVASGNSAARP
jgi:cholesterol transport system auxiliary component